MMFSGVVDKGETLWHKLDRLEKRNPGYKFENLNGQRIFSPIESARLLAPPKGSEVFIGRICKSVYEDELVPLFQAVAPLYKFRLMLEFNEASRGFGFATYFNPEDADKAVVALDCFEIRPRNYLAIFKSLDNRRLFMGQLPKNRTKEEIHQELNRKVDGVLDVIAYEDFNNPKLHRGFVFVEFTSHRLAAIARRQFIPHNLVLFGCKITVDWANPVPDVPSYTMNLIKILYLTNLPIRQTTEEFYNSIKSRLGYLRVTRIFKKDNYAFIHFDDRPSAKKAFENLLGAQVGGHEIRVEWARPKDYSYSNNVFTGMCKSVPAKQRQRALRQIVPDNLEFNATTSQDLPLFESSSNTTFSPGTSESSSTRSWSPPKEYGPLGVPSRNFSMGTPTLTINPFEDLLDKIINVPLGSGDISQIIASSFANSFYQ